MSRFAFPCFVALLCLFLFACGGGGGGSGGSTASRNNGSTDPTSPARGLALSAVYLAGPLTAPTRQPTYVKTLVADLNGDGRNDVVTFTNATVNGSDVVVFYQDQRGQLSAFVSFNSMTDLGLMTVNDIAVADMNGDGRADLIVLGIALPVPTGIGYGPPIVVLQQDASGNLAAPIPISVVIGGLTLGQQDLGPRFAVGDLNGDGRNDIVVSGNPMTVLLQGADGNVGTGLGSTFRVNGYASMLGEVHIADMNSDGRNDIVFQALQDRTIGVLRQTAPGVFANAADLYPVTLGYFTTFNTFAVGDLNGDGKNDIAVPDPGNNGFINIFLQNSAGTLDPPHLVPMIAPYYGITIADIDKDGLNDILGDIVVVDLPTSIGEVHVLRQNSDHSFQSPMIYTFQTAGGGGSPFCQAMSVGDINNDGWPDAVVAWMDEGIFAMLNVPH